MASPDAVEKGAHAGKLLKEVAAILGGKGGGNPTLAQGGAADASKLNEAVQKAPEIFESMMKAKG